MPNTKTIKTFCAEVAALFHPERIILFGSHAEGRQTPDSDVDILVVMPFTGRGVDKALEILNAVNPSFPIDLLVRTPEQVEKRLAMGDFFMREITEKGKTLYEVSHERVGEKGGRGSCHGTARASGSKVA